MAAEGERKTVRKRNAPHRLIEDDKEEAALSTKEAKESKRSIVITDSSDEDHVRAEKKKYRKGRKKTKRDNSPSSSSQSSSSSEAYSSSSPHKTKKNKGKKTQKSSKSKREQVIGRYKKVLRYLSKGATKTEAYLKCGVDRKTIVDSCAIAELEACDITAYNKLRATFQKGRSCPTLQNVADSCAHCNQCALP
ncbi:hypothetical protein G5714_004113 [Onychostoma macrolepis]|uniref:Uncharacterized protein n=1 Tax=Onychostoma macrolepis TaxID=369639 RepID=A0A7J6DCM5_9TELE|nr:hypothetical protein G5714_004113 [Onychostoma macrolepis]